MPRCFLPAGLALLLAAALPPAHAEDEAPAANVSSQTNQVDVATPPDLRDFPLHALRGTLVVGMAPQATLNGTDDRLAPGARIRNTDNLLLLPGTISGQKLLVVYTRDTYQLIKDVWVLRPSEAALPWPETAAQAATWTYNPLTRTWAKPQ
ncbi:MAG: hypothetical protein RI907_49 [Pseudomonadota bacterium]|jgi:hypothetical protein